MRATRDVDDVARVREARYEYTQQCRYEYDGGVGRKGGRRRRIRLDDGFDSTTVRALVGSLPLVCGI